MKSRVSCCNLALLRRDLVRSALIWGAYLLIWLVALPANLYSQGSRELMGMRRDILDIAASVCHPIGFFYGMAVAWFLFAYLNRSRSANFYGALPLRRETQFLTHYLAGLICGLVPNFLIMGATMAAGAGRGFNLVVDSGIWFAANSLTYLFYFSFAVLCAQVVGHVIAMPPLFAVLNLSAVVLEAMARDLGEALLFGLDLGPQKYTLAKLSPIYAWIDGSGPNCERVWVNDVVTEVYFTGWRDLLILGAVGIAMGALAFWFYRRRRMEAAGDVIAVRHLKPVFLWCFTFGCTIVVGAVIAPILVPDMTSAYFLSISLVLLGCTIVGYFLGQMILFKSLRVFRKKHFLDCAIACLAVIAVLVGCKLDVLGVEGWVPDADEVVGVRLGYAERDVEDPAYIAKVTELHEAILAEKAVTEAFSRDLEGNQRNHVTREEITYTLADGSTVKREYPFAMSQSRCEDPTSLIRRYEALLNEPEMILAREVPEEFELEDLETCKVRYYVYLADGKEGANNYLYPTKHQAMELFYQGIYLDLQEGNMGTRIVTDYVWEDAKGYAYEHGVEIATAEAMPIPEEEPHAELNVEFVLKKEDGRNWTYHHYTIPATATHSLAILKDLGVPQEVFDYLRS